MSDERAVAGGTLAEEHHDDREQVRRKRPKST